MRCPKKITNYDVLNNLSEDDIEFDLASCEQNCDKYLKCPLAKLMYNKLKELKEV